MDGELPKARPQEPILPLGIPPVAVAHSIDKPKPGTLTTTTFKDVVQRVKDIEANEQGNPRYLELWHYAKAQMTALDKAVQAGKITHEQRDEHLAVLMADSMLQSETDKVTGLLSKRAILAKTSQEIAGATRGKSPLTAAMCDLDKFKLLNDRYGHPVGDKVLEVLGKYLVNRLRLTDSIGRYGGEEVLIVLRDTDLTKAGELLSEVLRDMPNALKTMLLAEGIDIPEPITMSVGIMNLTEDSKANVRKRRGKTNKERDALLSNARDSLIKGADLSLYTAKGLGRNRVVQQTGEFEGNPIFTVLSTKKQYIKKQIETPEGREIQYELYEPPIPSTEID